MLPAAEFDVPGLHTAHTLDPAAEEYVPAAQSVHAVAPLVVEA